MPKITTDYGTVDVPAERILANDVTFPWEYNPHHVKLYSIHNVYGILGCVWASNEQDALDELVDAGLGAGLLIDEEDADDESARLGNAGEPADLDNVHVGIVPFSSFSPKLMCAFAEARGQGEATILDVYRWTHEDAEV